jgi:alpha-tubulin suppressor-like RCC1 family protein
MVVHDFPLTGISAIAIALGGSHSCVAETSGGIKCWGLNAHGQLGTGGSSWVQQLRPADVGDWQGMQRWGQDTSCTYQGTDRPPRGRT